MLAGMSFARVIVTYERIYLNFSVPQGSNTVYRIAILYESLSWKKKGPALDIRGSSGKELLA
jgi:hypothetical protein